jgi:CheY-like chemotaxis protein
MDSGYILVVDDDPPTRLLLRNLLEDDGFSVEAACDGIEAIEYCERELPNMMITDLNMPRLGGAELVGELHSRGLGSFPVIVISGREDCAEVAEGLSLNSMPKPFDSERLLQMVRTVAAA